MPIVRTSPLPERERAYRACAIRVKGKQPDNKPRGSLTWNVRTKRAHSLQAEAKQQLRNVIEKCCNAAALLYGFSG
jgi:hypothetical protein